MMMGGIRQSPSKQLAFVDAVKEEIISDWSTRLDITFIISR